MHNITFVFVIIKLETTAFSEEIESKKLYQSQDTALNIFHSLLRKRKRIKIRRLSSQEREIFLSDVKTPYYYRKHCKVTTEGLILGLSILNYWKTLKL
jgi:hypothetical protein